MTVVWMAMGALSVVACGERPRAEPVTARNQPPIVLISIDTLRADRLPVYGYRGVETPAIDRLRADSILFRNAYTTNPTTLPSHTSLLTGLAPTAHGVRDNVGYRLRPEVGPGLAERLREVGYATGAAVSAYVLRRRTGIGSGFDSYDDGVEVTAQGNLGSVQRSGGETLAAARRFLASRRERPVFLFLHLFEPHTPYAPPEPFASRYPHPYDGEIAAADAVVGDLLDDLERAGLYDAAAILLLSDHGEGLGNHGEEEHGVLLYRDTLHVPLLLKLPGGRRSGTQVEEAASLIDVAPTLLDLVGARHELPGTSLLSLAEAVPEAPRRRLYSETYYPRLHLGWSELTSLIDDRHHFVDGPQPELFDILADPAETTNRLDEERTTARSMRAELHQRAVPLTVPESVGAEEVERLAALGYLARSSRAEGDLPDPRSALPDLKELRSAYEMAARGEHEGAVAVLERLVARHPAMVDARFQLAASLQALGRDGEALALYEEGVALAPTAADGMLVEMARILARSGNLERAAGHARAAASTLPAEAYEVLAQIALARGRADTALELAQQAVASELVPRADSLLLQARIHMVREEHVEALVLLDRLRARVDAGRRPPVPALEFERGEALARLGRNREAARAFESEIDSFPRHARAYAHLAVIYTLLERGSEVAALLERMVSAHPSRDTYLLAAATAQRLGDAEAGAAWRNRAERTGE